MIGLRRTLTCSSFLSKTFVICCLGRGAEEISDTALMQQQHLFAVCFLGCTSRAREPAFA